MTAFFAGIDIGSTSIKAVMIDEKRSIVGKFITYTGGAFHSNAIAAFQKLLELTGIEQQQVLHVTSTGYGRKLFKEADEKISEITANTIGVRTAEFDEGNIRTIINIGGQDIKIIELDEEGRCANFMMNDKCAAGTGRFLEMVSRNLDIALEDLGSAHSRCSGAPVTINSTCTVFAESEIISLLAAGHSKWEIVAGIHYSIAKRIARMCRNVELNDLVLFDGGPALNQGLANAIEDELMRPLVVPPTPQITTALGAAITSLETYSQQKELSYA